MEQVQMGAFHYQLSGVFFFFLPFFFYSNHTAHVLFHRCPYRHLSHDMV